MDEPGRELPLSPPFRRDAGHCWIVALPAEFAELGDREGDTRRSPWRLTEDGRPIGEPHALHARIREEGRGAHSHWRAHLYFSTSDNRDPNSNGRRYALEFAPPRADVAERSAPHTAAPAPAPAPRPRRADTCAGAFAIVGSSYSGSTVLSAVMGAHPDIYNGGEVHLLAKDAAQRCAVCGWDCAFWTPARRAAIDPARLYDSLAAAAGRPFVADSSKMPDWFGRAGDFARDVPIVTILLAKHPVRHVASYLSKARYRDDLARFADPAAVLASLRKFYEIADARLAVNFDLRYEEFVHDPRTALTPILAGFGLGYDPAMDRWERADQHPFGGNIGPRIQMNRRNRTFDPFGAAKYRRAGLFHDNSYAEIMGLDAIERVLSNADARWIMRRFGYDSAPDPMPPLPPVVRPSQKPPGARAPWYIRPFRRGWRRLRRALRGR